MLLLLLLMFYYPDRGQRGATRVAAAPARDLCEGKSLSGLTLDIYSSLDFLSFPILFISEPLMDLFYPSLDFPILSLIFIYLEPSLCARVAGEGAREGMWRRPRAVCLPVCRGWRGRPLRHGLPGAHHLAGR